MKCWASVYLGGIGLLVPHLEWQVIAFLASESNLAFYLFGLGAMALLLSGTVGSAGPHALWGRKPPGTKKIADLEPEVHLGVWW
jgi:hypothetical protein